MLPLLASLIATLQGPPPPNPAARHRCVSVDAPIEQPCTLAPRFSGTAVAALMGGSDQIWWLDSDRLTLVARPGDGMAPIICCAIQLPLEPIAGTEFAAIVVRVPRIDEALLDVTHIPSRRGRPPEDIRGARAVQAPPRVETLAGTLETFSLHSVVLGEERTISVHLPPDVAPGERLPVVYLADGIPDSYAAIAEAAARDGRAGRAILVGLHSARGEIPNCGWNRCERRVLEFHPDITLAEPPARNPFLRHMAFVADELIPYIESRYPASRRREDRISAGSSAGGSWAFGAAETRPDLFGKVLAMSSSSRAAAARAEALRGSRVFAGGGIFDVGFFEPTRAAVEAARRAGGDATFREMVSGHSPHMWEVLFADGLAWLLPPGAEPR